MHSDHVSHSKHLARQVSDITTTFNSRPSVLGVDPKLVLVFELNEAIDLDEFRRADLLILDASNERAVVAFADDPHLAAFVERLGRYRSGPAEGHKRPQLEPFFDAIDETRSLAPEEKLTARLRAQLSGLDSPQELRLDLECWHPGEERAGDARTWLDELASAVTAAGGSVADSYLNNAVGLSLARCYMASDRIDQIAALDQVARIDLLPHPRLEPLQLFTIAAEDLPIADPPSMNAPIVAVVDSGVRSSHPLIGPALVGSETLTSELQDGEDESGHGTLIAGLILHGPLDQVVARGHAARPFCRILSVRVLDDASNFPNNVLWERELEEAIRYCAGQGATVINLSIGDADTVYRAPRPTPVAALLDSLARELQVVVVVSAGNIPPAGYMSVDLASATTYPEQLHKEGGAALIDPAPSALSLTVGSVIDVTATGGYSAQESAAVTPLGSTGWPSPFTRHGPGIRGAIKPELSHQGGTFAFNIGIGELTDDPELQVVSTGGGNRHARDRLLETSIGTSFSTALVSRVAAAIAARHPDAGPNLIRALALQAAASPDFIDEVSGGTEGRRRDFVLDLLGYGTPGIQEAIASQDHRTVLVSESAIPADGVHIYEIPVPSSFMEPGGSREIAVALAFDPPTRSRRLDYLGCRMEFRLFRNMDIQLLESLVLASPGGLGDVPEEEGDESDEDASAIDEPTPTRLSDLPHRYRIDLQPSAVRRSLGVNQLGRKIFNQRLPEATQVIYLVVKNTAVWIPENAQQNYAVAVTLSRDVNHDPIYAELEARLRVEVEVELEARP